MMHALWVFVVFGALGPTGLSAGDIALRDFVARHITLEKSIPADGEKVSNVTEVRLFFSGEPSIRGALIRIIDSSRSSVGSTPAALDAADPRQLFTTVERALPLGAYVVQWRVIADDGHVMRNSFRFEAVAE
jgi:methionine-rich copper-binding protein CopC